MNQETYEALKRIIELADWSRIGIKDKDIERDIKQIKGWLEEMEKEYEIIKIVRSA